ncbi:MAG TPA: DMT family transporter [Rhodospirillales bacterium]|nr:DMT family transporter [Rhodospirillales bacterium]
MPVIEISKIILVMFLWAICFPLIVAGFAYAPHLTFAALRAFLSGAALVGAGLLLGRRWPRGLGVWITLTLIGLGATSLAYLGMFHASEFVSPGIATVIANTQPLMAAVLAGMFLGENLDPRGKIGLALGFSGIVVIAIPQIMAAQGESYLIGTGYILLSALGITVSNVLIRKQAHQVDALMAMGAQMLIGGVPLAIGAFTLEQPGSVVWSLKFVLVLGALSLFGSSLAYWLWSQILRKTELNRANAFSFLVPVFGLSLGALFFNERLGWFEFIGIGLSLVGIAMASRSRAGTGAEAAGQVAEVRAGLE